MADILHSIFGYSHEEVNAFNEAHGINDFGPEYCASMGLTPNGEQTEATIHWTPEAAEARLGELAGLQAFDRAEAIGEETMRQGRIKSLVEGVRNGKVGKEDAIDKMKSNAGITTYKGYRNGQGLVDVNYPEVEREIGRIGKHFKTNTYEAMPKTERIPAVTYNSNGDLTYVKDSLNHVVYFNRAIPENVIRENLRANQEFDAKLILEGVSELRLAEINATTYSVNEAYIGETTQGNDHYLDIGHGSTTKKGKGPSMTGYVARKRLFNLFKHK